MGRREIIGIGLALAVAACSDKEASQEASKWYKPWFAQAGAEAVEEEAEAGDEASTEAESDPGAELEAGAEGEEEAEGEVHPPAEPEPQEARLVTIKVKRGETVQAYSKWSGVAEEELRTLNKIEGKKGLRMGANFQLMLDPAAFRKFEQARVEQLDRLEKDFFGRFEVVRLAKVTVKRGDNVWTVSKDHDGVPVWLIEKFNATSDMNALVIGTEVLVPVVQELAQAGTTVAGQLFAAGKETQPAKVPLAVRVAEAPARVEEADKPAPSDQQPRGLLVQVSRKETFGLYAQWADMKISDIQAANPGVSSSRLSVGQKIRVPVPDARAADFYRERRKFNGTPPPADIAPMREPKPVTAAATPKKDAFRRHKVTRGESAWVIATKRYKITINDLKRANPGMNLESLKVGDVLQVPVRNSRPGGARPARAPLMR